MKISEYKKLIPINKLKKSVDILWSQCIKFRDKKCVRTGKTEPEVKLNACHIFSRSQHSVRWDLDNGITLSSGEHIFWAHKNPMEFAEFVRERLGEEKYNALRIKSKQLIKVDRTLLENKMKELHDFIDGKS